GRVAAVSDDSVDSISRMNMLAQQANRGLRHHQRVGCVYSKLGKRRGVRLLAGVLDLELADRDKRRNRHIDRRRMRHHREMRARKRAALEQQDLAARVTYLLSRRTDHGYRQA